MCRQWRSPVTRILSWTIISVCSRPPRTPPAIAKKLRDEVAKAVAVPELVAEFRKQGMAPVGSEPEEFGRLIKSELALWTKVIRDAGIKPQ